MTSLILSFFVSTVSAEPTPTTAPFHDFTQQKQLPTRPTTNPAEWWAVAPLARPQVPTLSEADRKSSNPIDAFILSKLWQQGLTPAPEADRRTLIRRLTYDLHGLPPTPREVEDFVHDPDPAAYDHLVDRLLASPRFGERMGRLWLDVVHYGESNGYGMDRPRMNAWPYRDYVIRSFNEDKPYARFVQEQIAGDAIFPNESAAIPALGFIAAGPFNQSALVEQVGGTQCWKIALNLDRDDMVSNVAASFLSVTLHCARCHNHKFDPITQRDYYRMQSVFAGVMRGEREFDSEPSITQQRSRWVKVGEQLKQGAALSSLTATDRDELLKSGAAAEKALLDAEQEWKKLDVSIVPDVAPKAPSQADDIARSDAAPPEKETYVLTAKAPLKSIAALRLEILADLQAGTNAGENSRFQLSELAIETAPATAPKKFSPLKIRTAFADFSEKGCEISKAIDGQPKTAWSVHPKEAQAHQAAFVFDKPVGGKGGTFFTVRLETSRGAKKFISRLRFSASSREPSAAQIVSPAIVDLVKTPHAQRTTEAQRAITDALVPLMIEQKLSEFPTSRKVFAIGHDIAPLRNYKLPKEPAPIFILGRGDIGKPLEQVQPGALEAITSLPAVFTLKDPNDEASRRAALAKWITDDRNPLTWRSIANRVWLWNFDRGIVDTPNDFGRMGTPPSHPELLDWLACEMRDSGGSIKHLQRLIVTSATYRQSSPSVAANARQDADNRYFWRMNRHRLDAEQVRDTLLCVSGKLDLTMGGPPAMQFSYSDPNVAVSPRVDYDSFNPDDPASFRRGVYRFLFRNINDPLLEAFDVANPSLATPKRNVTTTALQTLSLLNNKFVLSECEHLAERLEKESPEVAEQIERAYLLLYARAPTSAEGSLIAQYAHKHGMAQTCRILVNANEFLFVP